MRKNPDIAYAFSPSDEHIPKLIRADVVVEETQETNRFAVRVGENLGGGRANDVQKATRVGTDRARPLRRSGQLER
jgi:hypothetical protein